MQLYKIVEKCPKREEETEAISTKCATPFWTTTCVLLFHKKVLYSKGLKNVLKSRKKVLFFV